MRLALIAAVVAIGFSPQISGQAPAQAPVAPPPAKVQITFEPGGLVTLVTAEATVKEVLAEWTRQGGSTFVNSERLGGGPMSVQFLHQPEKVVMASVLRQAAGYMLGPRRAGSIGASSFEVVYILPTSNPISTGGYMPPPNVQQYQQPQISTPGSPDDELPPVNRAQPQQGPGVQGQPGQPQQQTPASNPYPGPGVSGVAVPVVPVVPVTGNPTTPAQPPTTTGRGGGGGK